MTTLIVTATNEKQRDGTYMDLRVIVIIVNICKIVTTMTSQNTMHNKKPQLFFFTIKKIVVMTLLALTRRLRTYYELIVIHISVKVSLIVELKHLNRVHDDALVELFLSKPSSSRFAFHCVKMAHFYIFDTKLIYLICFEISLPIKSFLLFIT